MKKRMKLLASMAILLVFTACADNAQDSDRQTAEFWHIFRILSKNVKQALFQ